MKKFFEPEIAVVEFTVEDVITTSGECAVDGVVCNDDMGLG